jgi:hypothetical protein
LRGSHSDGHRWRRRDEHHAGESYRSARGQQLRDLAAHRVTHQDVRAQVAGFDDVLGVVGELIEIERTGHPVRRTPAALIVGDDSMA